MSVAVQQAQAAIMKLSGTEAFELEAQILDRVGTGTLPFEVALWETERCLVVPQAFTRHVGFDYAAGKSRVNGWPVFTRCTGGDVTPQGAGTLNVTLAYRLPVGSRPSIDEHYALLCKPIVEHLESWGYRPEFSAIDHSFCDGAHNLSVSGQKLVGTAQRWRRVRDGSGAQMVFAHALLLVDADLKSGIAATNQLYQNTKVAQTVHEDVHVNLKALCPTKQVRGFDAHGYASWLQDAYVTELSELTSRKTKLEGEEE